MAAWIGRLAVVFALIGVLAACSRSDGGERTSTSPGAPTIPLVTAPPLAAPCEPRRAPTPIRLTAVNKLYEPDCLATVAGTPSQIVFTNEDRGIRHNIAIFPGPRGYYTNPPYLFKGPFVTGPSVDQERLEPLPAGLLHFHCDLHPDLMHGLFAVAPTAAVVEDGIDVRWATKKSAPPGYVFDVQVKLPDASDFVDWLTHQTRFGARFTPTDSGLYAFRVAIYPASGELRPIGYSPATVVSWPSD
jgi:hypothetical protein